MSNSDASTTCDAIAQATCHWLERVVIGLNLCPFARWPWRNGQVRIQVSSATTIETLANDLQQELLRLDQVDPACCETTLLVHPKVLQDFHEYNDFLDIADGLVQSLDLEGILQVASFHPDYQFADSAPDDPANCTNRSPYPTLHLLRESSIERAIAGLADPGEIYQRNILTLRQLGQSGWLELMTAGSGK